MSNTFRNIVGIIATILYCLGLVDIEGFICIFGFGGGTTSSTTTVNNIPAYAEPTAQKMLTEAKTLSQTAYVNYAASTYATQNANETAGIGRLATRGRNGNANVTVSKDLVENILDGDYLVGAEPGGYFLTMLGDVTGKPTTTFAADVIPFLGGTPFLKGDPSSGYNLAQDLAGDIYTIINPRTSAYLYNDNYQTHRAIQHRVLGEGLELVKTEYDDAALLHYAGVLQRTYDQGLLTDSYNRYFEVQVGKSITHNRLKAAIAALVGSQQVTTTQYHRAGGGFGMLGMVAGAALAVAFPPAAGLSMAAIGTGASLGGMIGGGIDQMME